MIYYVTFGKTRNTGGRYYYSAENETNGVCMSVYFKKKTMHTHTNTNILKEKMTYSAPD